MALEVQVAIIAALASIGAALVSLFNTKRTFRLQRQAKLQERADTAKDALDSYREPLLRAAIQLGGRLDNIRNKAFLDTYLDRDDRRARIARTSTLYRIARYWCVVENLDDDFALLRFAADPATAPVAGMLREVGRAFATDKYDDNGAFMMWREEQRAIAELMRAESSTQCIGYATFDDQYADTFKPWFGTFDEHLTPVAARTSERFAALQEKLGLLAQRLDTSATYRDEWQALLSSDGARSSRALAEGAVG